MYAANEIALVQTLLVSSTYRSVRMEMCCLFDQIQTLSLWQTSCDDNIKLENECFCFSIEAPNETG